MHICSEYFTQPVNIQLVLCPPLTPILHEIAFLRAKTKSKLNLHVSHVCLSFGLVCKEAKADLAFLVDGSWSIGDDNFLKITRFLYSTIGSLDLIGPDGTQVSYSLQYVSVPQLTSEDESMLFLYVLTFAPFSQIHHYLNQISFI